MRTYIDFDIMKEDAQMTWSEAYLQGNPPTAEQIQDFYKVTFVESVVLIWRQSMQ